MTTIPGLLDGHIALGVECLIGKLATGDQPVVLGQITGSLSGRQ
jgi:hypothetical protein